jgi:hypothetical protein
MSDLSSSPSPPQGPARGKLRFLGIVAEFVGVGAVLAIIIYFAASGRESRRSPVLSAPDVTSQETPVDELRVASISRDENYRRLAAGTWQDFYHGKRTLTLKPDGTATMVVEFSGLKARLFTRRLTLQIVWSIEDGRMHRRTVGGSPADKVEFVNRRAGVQVAEPIVELTDEQMVLLDQDGSRQYRWRRVP